MNYNFTGSVTQRMINLGSANEISSSQLTQQAREERALRQEIRSRHAAATRIQSVYRGRKDAQQGRTLLRHRLQGEESSDFAQATKLVAVATDRSPLFRRMRRRQAPVKLSGAESAALKDDAAILLAWATRAIQIVGSSGESRECLCDRFVSENESEKVTPSPEPIFVALLSSPSSTTYGTCLRLVLRTILEHLRYQDGDTQHTFQPFVDVLLALMSKSSPDQNWSEWLITTGLLNAVRHHLMSFPASTKPNPQLLTSISGLIMASLKGASGAETSFAIKTITQSILTVPDLPNRISRTDLTQLVVELPLTEVLEVLPELEADRIVRDHSADLLANILAIGWKRLAHYTKGVQVRNYLLALSILQDNIAPGLLQSSHDLKGKSTGRAMMEAMDEESRPSSSRSTSSSSISPSTLTRLQILPSQQHISAILTASARFASSTREALCSFLASTLQSWDSVMRDQVLSCITYRHASTAANGASTASAATRGGGVASHSIEGLVRELWRGWFRGSRLAKSLSGDILQGRKALLATLQDEASRSTWPCLLVLCQLYSRSLLTIGDDEFYPAELKFGSTTSQAALNSSRNPLSIDEIVNLSAILRNLAFSLYWYEGTGGVLNDMSAGHVVGMKKMDLLSLRTIITRLLQQLHQRDSRRSFAPKDHWLMDGHLDLNSFIQSVVMEEQELNKQIDDNEDSAMDVDAAEAAIEDDEGDSASRPTISSRIASRRGGSLLRNGNAGGFLSARSLAYLSPRLGVLNNIPFVIPFEVRVEIFHQFTALDYVKASHSVDMRRPLREVSIRRSSVAEDGFTQLNGLGAQLKHRFSIKFIDQFGMEESGIDGGGLFKEFLTSLVKEAFDTDRGLWSATSDQQLYPNPHSYARTEESLRWYRFLGRILGKALYHGILVDVNFASFFLSKWLGKGNGYLDDLSGLESLDKEVYRNLLWLKHYTGDIERDLSLDFTVTDEEFGEKRVHELIPNGRNVAVTRENRLEYIYRVSHYRLNEQIRLQSEAFLAGLTDLIDLRWLRMLNREELRVLISGSEGEIDLEDLRKHTVLGSYHEKDEVVAYFWKCLESFTHAQRKAFLKFVTSCPSPPLLGFAQLNPNFGIRNGGDDTTRLPSSSTCVNLLKLPRYTSYEQCREKLLYAIESGAGFDLS